MHKLMLKFFKFLKDLIHFFKILTLFCILFLLLYWIQDLTGNRWNWTRIADFIVLPFIAIGGTFSDKSLELLGAKFEFKYAIATIILSLIYLFNNYLTKGVERLEIGYKNLRYDYKKHQENLLNAEIEQQTIVEQKRIQDYQIFVSTSIKPKFSHSSTKVNLQEQNDIMNKFLIEKTGVTPVAFENGFLYSFNNFDKIDKIIEIFFKLVKSSAPLDYIICIQIFGSEPEKEKEQLKKMITLKHLNKLITLSDTAWRYKFNNSHRYGLSQLGIYQHEDSTIEVQHFIEIL